MKRAAALLAALLAGGAAAAAPIADVTPETYAAKVVAPHRGRAVVVNFWATWCEPCRKEMPALAAAARRMASRGVAVVLVSADFPDQRGKAEKFLKDVGVALPSFLERADDPQTFIDRVDPKWDGSLPHTIAYGRDGKVFGSLAGEQTQESFEKLMADAAGVSR